MKLLSSDDASSTKTSHSRNFGSSSHTKQTQRQQAKAQPDDEEDTKTNAENQVDDEVEEVDDHLPPNQNLLNSRRKRMSNFLPPANSKAWQRPYWLGLALCLTLFAFWILDSLKDPVFASLVQGDLERHQPRAKLVSVVTTLLLVCSLEYWTHPSSPQQQETIREHDEIMDGGGIWTRMEISERGQGARLDHHHPRALDDVVSVHVFYIIGIPYVAVFLLLVYLLQQFQIAVVTGNVDQHQTSAWWYALGYALYAVIESFGSLAVATFWSYANSTLSLEDAERFYGPIIAIAQLGAIGGSTMVATNAWSAATLVLVAALVVVLQLLLMPVYHGRFPPTSPLLRLRGTATPDGKETLPPWQDDDVTMTKPFWSGIFLILRHTYVMLILGVSCLYEISLTCLDYQMKLLGLAKFDAASGGMSFRQFMGHYGQVVNVLSFIFSSWAFPLFIRRYGLRPTLRLFPTLLLIATLLAYGAIPGNLTVLFLSMAVLKAMTYSIHDPAKELLYLPTSNAVKFRAKFWIDVVGARVSKAMGSAMNAHAGSVSRSVRVGTIPSLVTALGLLIVCFWAGIEFDHLIRTGTIVGLDSDSDGTNTSEQRGRYRPVSIMEPSKDDDEDDDDDDDDDDDVEQIVFVKEQKMDHKTEGLSRSS